MAPQPEHIIERLVYPCDKKIALDENGLTIDTDWSKKYYGLLPLSDFAKLPGAIILSEGGMGKTTFLEKLHQLNKSNHSKLFKLGEYVGNHTGLTADIKACVSTISTTTYSIIFDGIDEAPELVGTLLRSLREKPATVIVWLASRDISAIRSIQDELGLKKFSLAPLSKKNILDLAKANGVDEGKFFSAAQQVGIIGICAKPMGCLLAISEFKDGRLDTAHQLYFWHHGIERLCDETPSSTKRMGAPSPYTLNQIVECAAWIAVNMALTNRVFAWIDEQSTCPANCLGIADLVHNSFDPGIIRTSLDRGVFSPVGDGRIRFSHTLYHDYLAALGLNRFIPSNNWSSLLLNRERRGVFPQRAGIATWLASLNDGFLEELAGIQPELLIMSAEAVKSIGPDKLCAALLARADNISYLQQRSSLISDNLFRLSHPNSVDVIKRYLSDGTTNELTMELAISIIQKCKMNELATILTDRVLNTALPIQQRVDAAHAVCQLEDELSKQRLLSLIPFNDKEDTQDQLRGLVLRCCFPRYLPLQELVKYLTQPQEKNFFGSYSNFLEFELPNLLNIEICEDNAPDVLSWSITHITKHDPFDRIGKLARTAYVRCWQWAENSAITGLLSKGYLNAIRAHVSPFTKNEYSNTPEELPNISRETFLQDTKKRFAVLNAILTESKINNHDLFFIVHH